MSLKNSNVWRRSSSYINSIKFIHISLSIIKEKRKKFDSHFRRIVCKFVTIQYDIVINYSCGIFAKIAVEFKNGWKTSKLLRSMMIFFFDYQQNFENFIGTLSENLRIFANFSMSHFLPAIFSGCFLFGSFWLRWKGWTVGFICAYSKKRLLSI